MIDCEAWLRDSDNMARFVAEAFPLFIRAVALDDDEWTDRARALWDRKVFGISDSMLRDLFGSTYMGNMFWDYVVGDLMKGYLAEHPDMEFDQYEPAFRATDSLRRYREWCAPEFEAAARAARQHELEQ